MLAVFMGEASRPFHDSVPPLLATDWRTALVTGDTADRHDLFSRADAMVTTHYAATLPQMLNLKLVQVPGAGYDGIDLAALPSSASLCNVFEHEPGVAEFALLAMLEWCHRLGTADAAVRNGDWSGSTGCTTPWRRPISSSLPVRSRPRPRAWSMQRLWLP